MIHLTDHGRRRVEERLCLRGEAAERLVQRAYDQGFTHSDTNGKLHRYVDGVFLKYGNANNVRIYGEWVFAFDRENLITVWVIPRDFRGALEKLRKRRKEAANG